MKLGKTTQFRSVFAAGVLLAGTMAVTAGSAVAQDPGMGSPGGQQPMPGDNRMGGQTTGSGGPNMTNYATAAFIRNVFENDQAQVQMSQLAQQKATSDDVKQFSEQMVNVHTKLDQQLEPMAKQLGVDKPKNPAKKYKKELEKLQGLSGENFESEYLQAMADAQQESIKQFDKQAKDDTNPSAQEAAKADGPVLEQNYQVLQKVAQAHNVNVAVAQTK